MWFDSKLPCRSQIAIAQHISAWNFQKEKKKHQQENQTKGVRRKYKKVKEKVLKKKNKKIKIMKKASSRWISKQTKKCKQKKP